MKITVDVTYMDGRLERVTAHPRTLAAFEKVHKRSLTAGRPSISDVLWLAWHGLGSPGGSVDAWVESIDDADVVNQGETAAAPFGTAPSGELSQ